MDKSELYNILDIDKPEEFEYYENMADLLETDEAVGKELIGELLAEVDMETFSDLIDSYFEEFLKMVPDTETDFYITVDTVKRSINGLIRENMHPEELDELASAVAGFREWYVNKALVFDLDTGNELPVRDAIFNISGAEFTGEKCNYDFRAALDYDVDSYEIKLRDIIDADAADVEAEGEK